MAKDYAKENSRPVRSGTGPAHPMLMGVIIGLLLGIIIALAVALWLNRLSNPFVEKGKGIEPLPRIGAAQPPPPPEAAKAAEKAAEKAKAAPDKSADPKDAKKAAAKNERPRFEFYQILPGDKEVTDKDIKAAKAAPPKAPAEAAKPGSSPQAPKAFSGETYWLQAGAFASEADADNLKAKIALSGLEASVRPVNVENKGTLYRVRLGPYQSVDDANRIKTALSQNGVAAAIIRTTEDTKK
ncbi:Cell division protein FtsN [Usitatibacter rugosus]|uniref:Cell division protein FtsN n=1 Tax=Usitatibacter rugosus TaxID=2732067 RepID=A0A6M4H0Z3_9PROT|nr:SPOR domain-containing protein [Usitatibacter rugosus]QJR13150.1 Cell division protein FtsN [Usitatibacter rugosus]